MGFPRFFLRRGIRLLQILCRCRFFSCFFLLSFLSRLWLLARVVGHASDLDGFFEIGEYVTMFVDYWNGFGGFEGVFLDRS